MQIWGPDPVTSVSLVTAAAAGDGDKAAVAAGDTWPGLMGRAAGHLARGVIELLGGGYGRRVVIVVGKGNNGGDGWAAAPRLATAGAHVTVASVVPLDARVSDEAAEFRAAWLKRGGRVRVGVDGLEALVATADVIVDCLLGTGVDGAPRGDVAIACRVINESGVRIVACDVPSGVSSDTGAAPDGAVRADLTVTFGAHKRGLWLSPGRDHVGRVVVGDLGGAWAADDDGWQMLTAAGAAPPGLDDGADKVSRGRALMVAGSVGAGGAAVLATRGLLGGGAGLVTLATPAPVQRVLVPAVPSAMTRRLPHQGEVVSAKAIDELRDAGDFDVVVAGPGLGHGEGTRAVAEHLLSTASRFVLDADAINVFRDDPQRLADHCGELVLTPHERELARIGGGDDGPDAWANRVTRVPRLARDLGAVIVAKGPGTMVASPDGRVWICPVGGPELGTGGTGDVLAGLVGAAIATSDDVPLAVARAVWWHAVAGELAARYRGGRPSSADVANEIGQAFAVLGEWSTSRPMAPFDTGLRRLLTGSP